MTTTVTVATGVKVDYEQFNRHLSVYKYAVRKTLAEVVKIQARLFCKDMCDYTPPFSGSAPASSKGGEGGFGNKARNKGRAAVSRDVRKIFAPIEQAGVREVANNGSVGVWMAWMKAKMGKPPPHDPEYIFKPIEKTGIMGVSTEDINRYNQRYAGKSAVKGKFFVHANMGDIQSEHVRRRGTKHYRVRKTRETVYVDNWSIVERYIKKVQYRVGRLKSGWYAAGKKLGFMPTAAWIAGQGSGDMIYVSKLIGVDPTVTVGSQIGRRHSMGYHFMRMAMNHRAYSMRVSVLKALGKRKDYRGLLAAAQALQGGYNISTTP